MKLGIIPGRRKERAVVASKHGIILIVPNRPTGRQPQPDLARWDGVNEFTLGHAAALWAEIEPTVPGSFNHPDAYPIFLTLKERMRAGDLPKPPKGVKPLRHIVTRTQLKSLAEKLQRRELRKPAGQRNPAFARLPKFLFPEERRKDSPQVRGGRARKWNEGLQTFLNGLHEKMTENGKPFTLSTVKDWLETNATERGGLETGIDDCDDLYFEGGIVSWTDHCAVHHLLAVRSLEPYIRRAKGS